MNVTLQQPMSCDACAIRNRAVCAKCNSDELKELEDIKYYRSFQAGQTIFYAGDDLEFVASIVTGVASLAKTMADGRVQMVGLLLPADFIGRPHTQTIESDVVAETDVLLCCFRRKPFEQMIDKTPHVGQRLLEMTLDELDAAREWMLVLGRKTAREKIANLLCMIAKRSAVLTDDADLSQAKFVLPLTREAMSDYLGLTIETVSRQMSQLRKDGLIAIESQRDVFVPDLAALQAETGDDI